MILVTCVSLSIKFFLLDRLSTLSSWLSAHLLENLFKKMFVDSKIAGGFSMAKDKLSYLISFGLFPYYSCQLSQNVQKCKRFVLFDESFNDILNREQMDISVKFLCEDRQMAVTRYWSWEFLQQVKCEWILIHPQGASVRCLATYNPRIELEMPW